MNQKKIFGLFNFTRCRTESGLALAVVGVVAGLALSSASVARADTTPPANKPAPTCGVPVCDIPAAIDALKAATEGARFQTLTNYRKAYKNSTDLATLHNLADFALKAVDMLKEVTANVSGQEYLVREAQGLYADMVMGLAKYSPLNGGELAGYYQQIAGEDSRYAILIYWHGRIKDFDDKDALLQLLDFFGRAEKISRDAHDSDYLAREAHADQDTITSRLVQLYPYFEGTYKITVKCTIASGESAPAYCQDGFIDHLVIMDTMGGAGIQVSLSNAASNTLMYAFNNVVLSEGGSVFEGQGSPSGVLSQIHLELDRSTGTVTGTVRNSDSLSTLQLEGKLDASPTAVYDFEARAAKQAPLKAEALSGLYKGQYAGHPVTMTLVSFGADQIGGTMSFDDQPNYKLRFQASRLYSQMGILVLVANTSSGAHVKLTAYFGKTDAGFAVHGLGFTDLSGSAQDLELTSVAQH
jgi:hypothetical protein